MGLLNRLRRKKKTEKEEKKKEEKEKPSEKTLLEELCGEDTELYEVLSRTMLLDPTQPSKEGIDFHAKKAKDFEEKGDSLRAKVEYELAGELALYEGKLTQVQKYFGKCAKMISDPNYRKFYEFYAKKENVERAMKAAQEYYARKLKPAEHKS